MARWQRRFLVLVALGIVVALGFVAREKLGVSFSVEGLQSFREWVGGLGWWGPAVFVLLVVFRLFIGLSSHLVLILGGLVFGVVGGIVWGSIGLLLSGLVLYFLATQLGADWVQSRFGDDYALMAERIRRVGAAAIFVLTAHPAGVLTLAHLAAGLVGLGVGRFAIAVALAAPVRATPFAYLGTAFLELSFLQTMALASGLLALFALPLLSSRLRSWLWPRKLEEAPEQHESA